MPVTKPDYLKQMAHPNRCAIFSDEFWMKNGFFYSFNEAVEKSTEVRILR
jgi:hypothetical protein